MDTLEYCPDDSASDADPQSLRREALAEFAGKSHEEFVRTTQAALDGLASVLNAWASQNHFKRRETWRGGPWTLWFETTGELRRRPMNSVELLLEHVLPERFFPLAELIGTLSNDDEIGLRIILASLALHEIDANNIDAAVMAITKLHENSENVRDLAERRLNHVTTLTENLVPAVETNIRAGETTIADIWAQYDWLISQGGNPRDIANKIAGRLKKENKCTAIHVRRVIKRGRSGGE